MSDPRTLALFAGPGGMDEAARLAELDLGILGIELNTDACATARAAGHQRLQADVRALSPADFPNTTGLVLTPPCPSFSASGLRSGMGDDYQAALDAVTCFGSGCGCEWEHLPERVTDARTALVVEAARWSLTLPSLEWVVCEQVPGVEYLWEDLAAELFAAGWEWVDVATLDAANFGAGARRVRTFLMARRYTPGHGDFYGPHVPGGTFAGVVGWGAGEHVRTRNNRRPTGGNLFSADGPSWCLTGKARTWERDSDRARFEAADAGALQGFPRDYPWQGSRTSAFQQAGDVVSPLVGAAVLGAVHGVDWRPAVTARAAQLAAGPAVHRPPSRLLSSQMVS
ncbi:MAG: DNA cytosine methyltransferase [Propionicimonas sp.]